MSEEMKQPFTFNGEELPDFVRVTGIEYPLLPDITPITRTIPRMYGEYNAGTTFKGGEFKFDIKLIITPELNILDAMDQLKKFLKGDNFEESLLVFKEQPSFYYEARVVGSTSIKDMFTYGEGSFTLYASKLIKYKSNIYRGSGNSIILENNGDLKVGFSININIATTGNKQLKIINTTTEEEMLLTSDGRPYSSRITIDTSKNTIKRGSKSLISDLDLESSWLKLKKGKNEIIFENGSGEKFLVNATATVIETYI